MKMQMHKKLNHFRNNYTLLLKVSVGDPEDSERTSEPRSEINRQLERWLNGKISQMNLQVWDVLAVGTLGSQVSK